jgi:predicted transcriptional regulator
MDRLTATRVFVEVVERGSQTAAADALEMSRAMVSRYLGGRALAAPHHAQVEPDRRG